MVYVRAYCLSEKQRTDKSKAGHQTKHYWSGIGCFCTFAVMFVAMVMVPIDNVELLVIPMSATAVFAFAVSYPACSMMRAYFRALDVMDRQLLCVSFATTKSTCCDMEHVSSSGQPMICDREVLRECVRTWFGSEAVFEDTLLL